MIKAIYKKNTGKFLLSLIPVVIVGVMAPMRSYVMQLLIDSKNYTHRYNKALMQKYSEILVMDTGKIVERGSFDELMQKEGEFFHLYKILSE